MLMKTNMVKNIFFVLYNYYFCILISGFDLHPYFAEQVFKTAFASHREAK